MRAKDGGLPRPRWSPDFRKHFTARLFSVLGSQCTYVAFPLLALQLFGPAQAALVTTASYGSTLVVGIPAGVLADRFGRRRLMIIAEIIQCAAMLAGTVALLTGLADLWLLCLVSFVNGAMHAVFGAASGSSIPDLVDRPALKAALSANEGRDAALGIIGPLLGAALLTFHHAAPFALATATFAVSVSVLALIGTPLRPQGDTGTRRPLQLTRGIALVATHRVLRGLVGSQVLLSFVLTGTFFTVLALLTSRGQPLGAGLVTALMGAGLLLGSALAPRAADRLGPLRWISLQAVVWGLALLVIAVRPGLVTAAVGLTVMWVIVPTVRVSAESWIADHVPTGERGRLQSIRSLSNALASPFGPLVCGVLAAAYGYRTTLLALAAIALAATLFALLSAGIRRPDGPAAEGDQEG
ncbi:MAG: MFS transporter [Propionibacteriaceae bacterium]